MNQNISLEDWIAERMRLRKENAYLKKQIASLLQKPKNTLERVLTMHVSTPYSWPCQFHGKAHSNNMLADFIDYMIKNKKYEYTIMSIKEYPF
jgi:hypothetical protein